MYFPYVSIIVPVLNEAENISECLKSLLCQSYPRELYEIIVVDNGSIDGSVSISRNYADMVLVKEGVKVGAVRNFGVKRAKGEIVAFIDGDCVASATWLSSAVDFLSKENVGAVGGGCLLRENPSWVERGWKLNSSRLTGRVKSLAGGSFILKKEIFEKLGGFNERINAGEDTKLSVDIKSLGLELWFIDQCYVVHLGYPSTLRGFLRREFWHASSYLKSNNGSKDKMFITVLIFFVSVLSLFVYIFTGYSFALWGASFVILIPIVFFVNQVRTQGIKDVPIASLFYSLVLSFVYYIGRMGGLAKSLFK